jgi:hypothetical protein
MTFVLNLDEDCGLTCQMEITLMHLQVRPFCGKKKNTQCIE